MTTACGLRTGVHAAITGEDLVLLDLAADDYVCLPAVAAGCRDVETVISGLSRAQADSLRAAGLLSDVPAPAGPLPVVASLDLRDFDRRRIAFADIATAGLAVADVARRGRDPTVGQLLDLARSVARRDDPHETLQASAAFSDLLPLLPVRSQCLHRSAVLMAFLGRKRLRATWVFGVRTWPFRAHCWVQIGDVCLNDDFERLRPYTPILAISS